MSVPNINSLRDDLLIELAVRKANKRNPQNVIVVCQALRPEVDWNEQRELARSAGWLLVRNDPALAKSQRDDDKSNAMLLALTAAGKSKASELFESKKPKTVGRWISEVPRSDWIALGALVVSLIAFLKPGS